jgi:hypothetical protein
LICQKCKTNEVTTPREGSPLPDPPDTLATSTSPHASLVVEERASISKGKILSLALKSNEEQVIDIEEENVHGKAASA